MEGTRIGVHDVIGLIVNGATVDEVCRSFPDLKRSHVYECLAYYAQRLCIVIAPLLVPTVAPLQEYTAV